MLLPGNSGSRVAPASGGDIDYQKEQKASPFQPTRMSVVPDFALTGHHAGEVSRLRFPMGETKS